MIEHTERSSLAACLASLMGLPVGEVPLDAGERGAWLAQRGLGLVPIADAAAFAWPGPWIAWRPALDAPGRRAVVMFGVPSGPIWDPAGTADEVHAGVLLAPLDVSSWVPPAQGAPGSGVVEAVLLGPVAEAPLVAVAEAVAIPGRGIAGDRYANGSGTFASGRPGSALTLIDAAVLDELEAERGGPVDHRRNIVVRGVALDALLGRRFHVGEVLCEGCRPCEPCAHLDRLNGGGVLRPLVHRGGLRADIVAGGTLRPGDRLIPA